MKDGLFDEEQIGSTAASKVMVNGSTFKWKPLNGVPQESILGQKLFNTIINDIDGETLEQDA